MDEKRSARRTIPILFTAVLLIGLLLRFYNLGQYPFGFDQLQIAQNAEQIIHGDLVFIGPRTGPAAMFTGPLIYYASAPFLFFVPPETATTLTALLLSAITGCALFFLGRRYFSVSIAMIMTIVWAASPFFISLDRIPWNPNLMMLAALLSFYPLLSSKKALEYVDVLFVSLGVFLGYQAHFSGLLLLPLVLCGLVIHIRLRRARSVMLVPPVIAFVLSILPTILFDFRNDWHNARGLWALVSDRERVGEYQILSRIFHKLSVSAETAGKILFFRNHYVMLFLSGGVIWFTGVWQLLTDKVKTPAWITLLTLGTVTLSFAAYRESTPEYYFAILFPLLLLLLARLIVKIPIQIRLGLLVFFLVYGAWMTKAVYSADIGLTAGAQRKIVVALQYYAERTPIQAVVYDADPVDVEGLKYLIEREGISFSTQGNIFHVIYPTPEHAQVTDMVSSNASYWLEDIAAGKRHTLTIEDMSVSVPADWQIMRNLTLTSGVDLELVVTTMVHGGPYLVSIRKESHHLEYFRDIRARMSLRPPLIGEWTAIEYAGEPLYATIRADKLVTISTSDTTAIEEFLYDFQLR